VEDRGFKSVEFEIPIIWETPGEATIAVNNRILKLTNSESGMMDLKVNLPIPRDGKFVIKILKATTRIFYYVDVQRNYGRTIIGDIQPPGEVVCRGYFSFKKIQESIPESQKEEKEDQKGLEENSSQGQLTVQINEPQRPLTARCYRFS